MDLVTLLDDHVPDGGGNKLLLLSIDDLVR